MLLAVEMQQYVQSDGDSLYPLLEREAHDTQSLMSKLPSGTSPEWRSFTLSDVMPHKLVWEHFGVFLVLYDPF